MDRSLNVASVGYFNAKPLIAGLGEVPGINLSLHVPSALAGLLERGDADVALLPVIDFFRMPALRLLPDAGGIGCDGPTLTVRLFSQTPFDRITRLCCDPDSHTSVQLARIILRERFGSDPDLADLYAADGRPGEARLLIGDKVVCEEPVGFEHQLDLGSAWKDMTGLPFVFACWTARENTDLGNLVEQLQAARTRGLADVDRLIKKHAIPRGWPPGIAERYLTEYLKYNVGPRQLEAIARYRDLSQPAPTPVG